MTPSAPPCDCYTLAMPREPFLPSLGHALRNNHRPFDRVSLALRLLVVIAIFGFAVGYVADSLHWKMMDDAPIMHYVNFLMDHGLQPYSDITDNNLPGAYLTEGWAMRLFGGTDVAWRICDFFLLAVLCGAAVLIARPYDWLAGLLGGGLFLIIHASEGPRYAGEREQVIATALLVGYAAAFEALRRRQPWLMAIFGVMGGLAISIKPTFAPLAVAVLVMAAVVLRRRQVRAGAYVAWAVGGGLAVAGVILGFLLRHHALRNFWFILTVVIPSYQGVWPAPMVDMLTRMFPLTAAPLLVLGLALAAGKTKRWTWEQWALLLGAAVGLASYFVQRKAFLHHRYVWLACCFLLCSLEFSAGMRRAGWRRVTACAAVLFACLVCVPRYGRLMAANVNTNEFMTTLASDLTQVGAGDPQRTLQGQVMCFDLVSGCLNALYHLNLVENSGFTGDLMFFRKTMSPPVTFYRNLYWQRDRQNPPTVLVIGNEWFGENDSFAKVDTWPEFTQNLAQNYRLVLSRAFPHLDSKNQPGKSKEPRGYRIYVRRGSAMDASSPVTSSAQSGK